MWSQKTLIWKIYFIISLYALNWYILLMRTRNNTHTHFHVHLKSKG